MRYDTQALKDFCRRVMESIGLPEKESRDFSESLVNADMRGVASHGLTRLKTYYQRLKDGLVDAHAQPRIVTGLPSLLIVDGQNAMGVSSAVYAMEQCIVRARTTGCCFASVRGGNHFGYAAYFAQLAAREGMIGLAAANGPPAIAPIGGKEPVLGTNPLAVAIPAKDSVPLVLDMATSTVARGKVNLAKKEGKPIPADWGIDANGLPTTDPAAVKCMLPFGGPKGFGITLIIEILCSCLSGAKNGLTMGSFYDFSGTTQDSGFFLGALDISGVAGPDAFGGSVDDLFHAIKGSPRADNCEEILIPGEIEHRKYQAALARGIEIPSSTLKELEELSVTCNVPFQCEMKGAQ